jgi:SNF2-related domain/Helicase conserved C-terminal domain
MNRAGVPVDLQTIEAALGQFSVVVVNGGKRLFEEGRVRSLNETAHPNTYEGEVYEKKAGKSYQVTLSFGKSASNLLCTCQIGSECKHVYAALLFLSKRFRKQALVLKKESKNDKKVSDYFSLVADPALLTEKLTDFVERLEELFQTYKKGNQINGRILKGLFSDWPPEEHWSEIKIASGEPLSRVQFWHFLVTHLQQRGLKIPSLFGELNDTTPSRDLIEKWSNSQEAQKWIIRFERNDEPGVYQRLDSEFRWTVDAGYLCLEVKDGNDVPFRPVRVNELHLLATDWRSGRSQISSESLLLLLQHFLADAYQPPVRLPLTPGLAGRLNGLFQSDEIRRRTVGSDGQPLHLENGSAGWEMIEATDLWYRFQLRHQGEVPNGKLLMLPGPTTLYWFGSTLLEAGPPPFPMDSLECDPVMEIPRSAVESVPGIRYLLDTIPALPDSLSKRVTRIQPKRVLRVRTEPTELGESVVFVTRLVDPNHGTEIQSGGHCGWTLSGKRVVQEGDHFSVYQLEDQMAYNQLFGRLPSEFDPSSKSWRVKNPKRAVDLFAKWSQTLPVDVELEIPESLKGLRAKPLEIDFSFDCDDAGNDWFDLRFSWSEADLALSPEELQALLDARGNLVQFSARAYRSLLIRQPQKLIKTLSELGISPRDLAAGPQRLHLLQLRSLLTANLVPKELQQELERRLAEIKTEVVCDIPDTIRATLRPYQITGFHFLAYLSSNRFGGILADDMGLGKTIQTLTWIAWLRHTATPAGPSLIVCPKSVVDNWLGEAERYFPALPIAALKKPELHAKLVEPGQVLVLNYTQLRILSEHLAQIEWDAVIFDEGQYLKNANSQTAQSARALKATHKILLTGTPIENKLLDLWSLMSCVMPGALGTQSSFKREFQDSGDAESRLRLSRRARPFLLRRTKEEVALELPPKIEEDIRVTIEGRQEELYQAEIKVARQHLLKIQNGEQLDQERFNLLTSLLRLRQICCHPALAGLKDELATSAKLEALVDLVEPLIEEGNKVLVFSQFVEMLRLIEERISNLGCPLFKLTGKTENRGDLIMNFRNTPGAAVFLISLKAGGSGLNLEAASYVILFDPWWNPAVENQAIDRTHRIGQTKTVFAYRLLVRDTIEDKIRQLQIRKSNLAKDVLGEEAFGRALTLEDFRYLLE